MAEYIFGASNRSSGDVSAQGQRQKITPERVFTVNELAGKHLGPVELINVVAAIIQGRGFVLVNNCEYADSGLTCFSAPFSGSLGLLSRPRLL